MSIVGKNLPKNVVLGDAGVKGQTFATRSKSGYLLYRFAKSLKSGQGLPIYVLHESFS